MLNIGREKEKCLPASMKREGNGKKRVRLPFAEKVRILLSLVRKREKAKW